MDIKKNNASPIERLPFYYQYFIMKKEHQVENVTAKDMAQEFGFKSGSSVSRDMTELFGNSGRKNYGYNVNYICNCMKRLMDLEHPKTILIIGESPFLINEEKFKNNGFLIKTDKLDNYFILDETDISLVILAKEISEEAFILIASKVAAIINMSGHKYNSVGIPVYEFDIFNIILNSWFSTIKDKIKAL